MKKIGGAGKKPFATFGGGKAMKTVAPKADVKPKTMVSKGLRSPAQPVGSHVVMKPSRGR